MPFAKWERVIQDELGNLVESCTVTVRRLPGLVLQPLKADYDGASSKSNPFTVTDGRAKFYAPGGRYQIGVVSPGGYTATYTDELVGTLAGQDANAYVGPGFTWAPEEETTTPPSEGCIRANTADWADATHLYVHDTTLSGSDVTSWLLGLDPGSKSVKNRALLSLADGTELSWEVDDVTDAGDYLDITVSGYVGPAGPVTVAPSGYIVLSRERSGNDGLNGTGLVDSVEAGTGISVNSGDPTAPEVALASMAEATLKGRAAGAGTGAPVDLTVAQLRAILGIKGPIQEFYIANTTERSTTSTSFVDLTGFSQSITLGDAANIVEIEVHIQVTNDGANSGGQVKFRRGTTDLATVIAYQEVDVGEQVKTMSFKFRDTPGSVGAHSYNLQFRSYASDAFIVSDGDILSTMFVRELLP